MRKSIKALAVSGAALAAFAVAGTAHAAPGPVTGAISPAVSSDAGQAGYAAGADQGTDFTHFSTLVGLGRQYSVTNPALPDIGAGSQFANLSAGWHTATNAAVVQLADEAVGVQFGTRGSETVSLGVVRAGGSNIVVAAVSGLPAGAAEYNVIAKYPTSHTVGLDLLNNAVSPFTFAGRHFALGSVVFSAQDESVGISSTEIADSTGIHGPGAVHTPFHSAFAGVLFGAQRASGGVSSISTVPVAETAQGIVVRLAHMHLNANKPGAHEVFSEGFQTAANWSVTPVFALSGTTDVAAPTVFTSDHLSVTELNTAAS